MHSSMGINVMLDVVLLNRPELVVFAIAILFLLLYYRIAGYGKEEKITWILMLVPFLYFSINMLTEVVTVDEPQYEQCITNIRNIKDNSAAWKVLYEYKFAQLTIGSVFWFFSEDLKERLGDNNLWMIYKALHWLLVYIISLVTVSVWRKNVISTFDDRRKRICENLFLILLIGSPLACLLMKNTNYDAGSTYPAILGVVLLWAAFNKNDKKLGYFATLTTALGVLDKWTALVYWIVATILYAYLSIRDKETWQNRVIWSTLEVGKSYIGALLLSLLYFAYANIQQGGFAYDVDLGVVVFSFVHAIKAIFTGDLSVNSSVDDIVYIPVLFLIMVFSSLVVSAVVRGTSKKNASVNVLLRTDAILLFLGIILGIVGTYFVPMRIAPFLEIENGKYISTDSFTGWTYHYGANTAVGHFIAKICYQWATIITVFPAILLLLCLICSATVFIKTCDEDKLPLPLFLSCALVLLFLYSVAGLPIDAKYYSYPIFIIGIYAIYMTCKFLSFDKKYFIAFFYILCVVEMAMFIPNVKSFSPIWLWHDHEHNTQVRKGQWYAGEIYFWGEQNAIAGSIIKELIDPNINEEEVILYSDYVTTWPGNPGYNMVALSSQEKSNLRFDDKAYYIFNKFIVFRQDTPRYLVDVKPIATISYKGEIGAWIYRGDQLAEYASELVE